MSAGVIVRHDCGRLILEGQRCVCQPRRLLSCDCTPSGNHEHRGPSCNQRDRDIWAQAISRMRPPPP